MTAVRDGQAQGRYEGGTLQRKKKMKQKNYLSLLFIPHKNLLRGFSKKRTDRDDADDCAKSAWFSFFAEALANTHGRHLARTILARAEAIDEHLGDTRRDRLTATDAEATRARIRRSGPPTPPGNSKKRCRQYMQMRDSQ